jgi:hypothetical protein
MTKRSLDSRKRRVLDKTAKLRGRANNAQEWAQQFQFRWDDCVDLLEQHGFISESNSRHSIARDALLFVNAAMKRADPLPIEVAWCAEVLCSASETWARFEILHEKLAGIPNGTTLLNELALAAHAYGTIERAQALAEAGLFAAWARQDLKLQDLDAARTARVLRRSAEKDRAWRDFSAARKANPAVTPRSWALKEGRAAQYEMAPNTLRKAMAEMLKEENGRPKVAGVVTPSNRETPAG